MKPRLIAALLAATALAAPLAAEPSSIDFATQAGAAEASASPFARFAPAADRREHRIDYAHWDEALGWFVVPMGPSLRQQPTPIAVNTGSRRVYGHDSRYRLEGNRVAFSYMTPQIISALSEYRADLERVGSEMDITRLPRNEQLAFWLNLHNVAVIEALAKEYPLAEPHERQFGSNRAALDEAKLVTIAGVELSPRDIRTRIVYPNWRDPKVIYGFWHGVIGGPSIQRLAYTGDNVDALLALSGEEFVNSLRGVESWGNRLRLSPVYEEAAPFYFANGDALRTHLVQFAREDVRDLVTRTQAVAYKPLERDIADLQRGEVEPQHNFLTQTDCKYESCAGAAASLNQSGGPSIRVNPAIARLVRERREKLDRARRAGIRTGMVIYGDGEYSEGEAAREVE